ncbi:MAG: RNase A-like domain-containing protein [Tepidiformaceae bacterium]
MKNRLSTYLPIALVGLLVVGGYLYLTYRDSGTADGQPSAQATADARDPATSKNARATARPAATRTAESSANPARHDLQPDEEQGGHTLARHVGKSDDELKARLLRESDISAASTYTDREAAERAVAAALTKGRTQLATWEKGTSNQNLVLRVSMPETVGRSLRRGESKVEAVKSAIIVLTRDGGDWFVLTSYPEDR